MSGRRDHGRRASAAWVVVPHRFVAGCATAAVGERIAVYDHRNNITRYAYQSAERDFVGTSAQAADAAEKRPSWFGAPWEKPDHEQGRSEVALRIGESRGRMSLRPARRAAKLGRIDCCSKSLQIKRASIERVRHRVSVLSQLEQWYARQCDGTWEHSPGVAIESRDQGWWVKVNLKGTQLQHVAFSEIATNVDAARIPQGPRWLHCWTQDGIWHGAGDETKLRRILELFLDWANTHGG